jgi:cell division protein FtsQ
MFKKRIWKHIMTGSAWAITLGGLVVLMGFIEYKKSGVFCKEIKIYIPGNQYFIDKAEVDHILKVHKHQLVGRDMQSINLHELEDRLKANPFIASASVYENMDGVIKVQISQRQPVVRVINKSGQDFYIDQNGLKIPMSSNFTAKVLAANGFIDEPFGNKLDTLHTAIAKELFRAAQYINADSLWSAQIEQMYVNADHDIVLIPRVGKQRILLGDADSLENKFHNLLVFYKQALPLVGWDRYKEINIKFANQVIGIKSDDFKRDSLKAVVAADSLKKTKETFTNTN